MNHRRQTPSVRIGSVLMGSAHPIVVQSMTNTPTANVEQTVAQIKELADAGSELVRITVNDAAAMQAVPAIRAALDADGYPVPLIGDFHYNGHILLTEYPDSAACLAKFRVNPGNVGKGDRRDQQFEMIIKAAIHHKKAVRIGVNWGSLDPVIVAKAMDANQALPVPQSATDVMIEAMLESARQSEALALAIGLPKDQLVLSVKMSDVAAMVRVYEQLAQETDTVLHLGLTEAGSQHKGSISSAIALGILLHQGIGDTIRMSLTPSPGASRAEEVRGCKTVLQAMGLRHFTPSVVSCPGCGRTQSDAFIRLAESIQTHIDQTIQTWRTQYPGVESLTVAVMGCVVNGPGESKHADIGISLPGISETPRAPVYIDGKQVTTLRGDGIQTEFIQLLEQYIQDRFSKKSS